MRWLQLVHAEARVSPGLGVQVYIFSQPYFDFPASSQHDIDTAHIHEIDIAQIPGYWYDLHLRNLEMQPLGKKTYYDYTSRYEYIDCHYELCTGLHSYLWVG